MFMDIVKFTFIYNTADKNLLQIISLNKQSIM